MGIHKLKVRACKVFCMNIDHWLIRPPEQTQRPALRYEVFKISRIIQAVYALKMG